MNDNRSEMYSINSGYYDLPVKEPWVCGKTLYSVITISSAVLVGVAAACFFAPWLFGNTTLTATGITLIGAYYAIFAIFAPFILFCSFNGCCSKYYISDRRRFFTFKISATLSSRRSVHTA